MIRGLLSIYSWRYLPGIVALLQHHNFKIAPFLRQYWQTERFDMLQNSITLRPSRTTKLLTAFVAVGSLVQIVAGLWLIVAWFANREPGLWEFGLALVLSYPLVWAHLLAVPVWLSYTGRPKYVGRRILCYTFQAQFKRLRKRHDFKIVAVAGSVGKTSTKVAVAKALGASKRVLWQEGNYNVDITVPLVIFGQPLPGLFNIPAWIRIWKQNEQTIRKPYPYDLVVLELGTDGPGQIAQFAYLQPDVLIVTAITPEHMEYFGTLDEVAREELTAVTFAKKTLINIDDTPRQYLEGLTFESYGLSDTAMYRATKRKARGFKGQQVTFVLGSDHSFTATIPMLGQQGAKIAVAAAAVAHALGESNEAVQDGLKHVEAFAGRMRLFEGIKESTIIDDTYNASPIAVNAALDVLYDIDAPQRIAILGTMNELGSYSPAAHQEVGDHCDPAKLDFVVTIGADAKKYLAPRAKKQGCTVHSFDSPYAAGEFVKKKLKKRAVVLGKGSQNRVFAEEALKQLLANSADSEQMVRQSAYWMSKKRQQFTDYK